MSSIETDVRPFEESDVIKYITEDEQAEIETYRKNIRNYAAALRQNGQLTHKGRQVKTKPDLKKICQDEGWNGLLNDMEVLNNVGL